MIWFPDPPQATTWTDWMMIAGVWVMLQLIRGAHRMHCEERAWRDYERMSQTDSADAIQAKRVALHDEAVADQNRIDRIVRE